MARKKVTYRPNKASGVFGVVWGGLFVLIGLVFIVPTFGGFGVLWTLGALAITAVNAYRTFGKNYVGPEIYIEDDGADSAAASSIEERLQELRNLYDRSLITEEEYEAKKQEILKEL